MPECDIYVRVSTKEQAESGTSLQSQEKLCKELSAKKGLTVRNIYREDWTGSELDRPQLNLLRKGNRTSPPQALICYSTDRLSRDPIHLAILAEECDKNRIELIFVSEPLDNSTEGQLIRYIKGYAAKIEREKIRERTVRGKKERALSGKLPTGGGGLYGYDYDKNSGCRIINDDQAQIVRLIFRWIVEENCTIWKICRKLTEMGVPSPRGSKIWGLATIGRMVHNPSYAGHAHALKYITSEPQTRRNPETRVRKGIVRYRPLEEWIPLEGNTPPIISDKTYQKAQEVIATHARNASRNAKRQYLLRGHIFCALCNQRMYGEPNHKNFYYICHYKRKIATLTLCRNRTLPAQKYEDAVWNLIKQALLDPSQILAELERRQKPQDTNLSDLIDALQSRLKKNQTAKQRLTNLFAFAEIDEEMLLTQIKLLTREAEGLQGELQKLTSQQSQALSWHAGKDQINLYCTQAAQNIEEFSFEDKRNALAALHVKVLVSPDKIEVTGLLPPGRVDFPTSSSWETNPSFPFRFSLAPLS